MGRAIYGPAPKPVNTLALDESGPRGLDRRNRGSRRNGFMIHIIFEIIRAILGLISLVLIVYVVISWLYAFDVVSRRNQILGSIWEFCRAVIDPLVRPLRRLIPPIAGVDLSVMVLLLAIILLQDALPWIEGMLRGGPVL